MAERRWTAACERRATQIWQRLLIHFGSVALSVDEHGGEQIHRYDVRAKDLGKLYSQERLRLPPMGATECARLFAELKQHLMLMAVTRTHFAAGFPHKSCLMFEMHPHQLLQPCEEKGKLDRLALTVCNHQSAIAR